MNPLQLSGDDDEDDKTRDLPHSVLVTCTDSCDVLCLFNVERYDLVTMTKAPFQSCKRVLHIHGR